MGMIEDYATRNDRLERTNSSSAKFAAEDGSRRLLQALERYFAKRRAEQREREQAEAR